MTETAEWTHTPVVSGGDAPAVFAPGWLPDDTTPFPELDDLRREHDRIRAQSRAAASEVGRIQQQLDSGAKAREVAMRDAYLNGKPEPKPVDNAKLEGELAQAQERNRAAGAALFESVNRCIALVAGHREEWLGVFAQAEAGFQLEAEDALAKYREALAKKGQFARLEHWIDRTGGDAAELPARHYAYADIPEPIDPEDKKAQEKFLQDATLASYAGGLPGTRISDDESRALEREQQRPPEIDPHSVTVTTLTV